MKYYYNLYKAWKTHEDIFGRYYDHEYFTNDEIQNIEIHELECSEDEFWDNSDKCQKYDDYWCVYEICYDSTEFAEFENEDEAREMLRRCLDMCIYEHINDI